MRAAITIESFRPGPGGVEAAAFELARELARRSVDLTVLCREAWPEPLAGVRVQALGGPTFWQPLRVLEFSRRSARAARAGGFDVVQGFSRTRHQHVYRAGGGSHAAYLERMYTRPRLARLSPRHAVLLALEGAAFADPAQQILCNSRFAAEEIARRHGVPAARLHVAYNGVDLERFHPGRRGAARARLGAELGLEGPFALFAGSGFARKGLDRAIAGLAHAGVKADLLVAGAGSAGPFRAQAESLGVSGRVHFLGLRADVPDLCAAADLFVLPTRYDPFSNACLEALASGTPVATTLDNGAAELVEPGANGFHCADDFSPALRALEDPARLRALGAAARRTAERFTWSAHADAVLELWGRLAR
ncbi:MAG TPA: glycosyltransferase family 4 protein [Myxococcota bacterium]|nr:glycosyltransferase family 4 protein [Myxococcota bacterium]